MEILQLRYFCDAAETENFSKTAKKFGVPPSNISQCIKRLEKELSVSLFDRKSNSLFLNEQGRAFYERVDEALRQIDRACIEACDKKQPEQIKICITANRRIVMQAIEEFSLQHPLSRFVIAYEFDPSEEYDLVIGDGIFDKKSLEKKCLISEAIALAMKNDHPLAKKETIDIEDLKLLNFIIMSKKSSLYRVTNRFCEMSALEMNVVIQCDDPFYMRKCVELGLGVAFVPVFSWSGQFSEKVVIKPIDGFRRRTYAFWKKNQSLSITARAFLNVLIAECEKEN